MLVDGLMFEPAALGVALLVLLALRAMWRGATRCYRQ